ncbi:MAG TPA: flagellar basal-body rod protein FlgG [Methylococcaceae bacterium]|jgi:flagellar basal-body rod protein FlgG|nr:flagellar basal-body rod protein FlgG [Methylococcaceae bacterium]HIN68745.1 flagellar basal-body rod protein FlgG [Methylococcales bacterium]HIA44213.1 flagellar basal-body rod protein FlgG [Methylococcaceae bacterium]HIB63240.1 flagellar basal-body rod protein FlgG [Methylococcaceae bacterium]HIO13307.1 flagellar basal-body rod protein FlgG [Methylococcales bacterium]
MEASLWVAKTGLDAQQKRMTVISNNLANVNTMGFKRDRAVFEDLLYQNFNQAGAQTSAATQSPTGLMLGTGTRIVSTEKLHTQGNMVQTQNSLDIAVDGAGFFQVLRPDGVMGYTRNGSFKLSQVGQLVTPSGYLIQPAVNIPPNARSITIGSDGSVSVQFFDQPAAQMIGQINVNTFLNPAGLQPMGENMFVETFASGPANQMLPTQNGAGKLVQGALEASNVNVVEEMVSMIETQRAYEVNSKAISSANQMLQFLNQNL